MSDGRWVRCARFAQLLCRTCAVGRTRGSICREIMLRFERTGFDEEAVGCPGFQRFRLACYRRRASCRECDRRRKIILWGRNLSRISVPTMGRAYLLLSNAADGHDFEGRELVRVSEREVNLAEPPVVSDGHDFRFEPIAEMNNINSAKNDRECDENPSFFIHKQMNVTAGAAVQPPIQTWQGVEML